MLVHIWESLLQERQSEAQIMSDLYHAVLSQDSLALCTLGKSGQPLLFKEDSQTRTSIYRKTFERAHPSVCYVSPSCKTAPYPCSSKGELLLLQLLMFKQVSALGWCAPLLLPKTALVYFSRIKCLEA